MSKIIWIFLIFFYIEEYDFGGTIFYTDIPLKLHFLNHYIF